LNGVAFDFVKPLMAIQTPIAIIAIHQNMPPVFRWMKNSL